MNPLTPETVRINPDLLAAIEARARRARAQAAHSLILRLFQALKPRVDGRPWGVHWG